MEVQEVLNRGEAFLLGMSTLASDGRLLETEGMLYLKAITANGSVVSIHPDCPIQMEMPVQGRRAGTKWFKGDLTDQALYWAELPGGFDNQTDISNLATGQQLFQVLCTSCHCPNLGSDFVGPALGNITQFRDKRWLRQFTRNSQAVITSGDSVANCLWNRWKPTMMSSFPQLSDLQIDAIYQFIAEESARISVPLDSNYYACQPYFPETEQLVHAEDTNAMITRLPLGLVPVKPNRYFAKIYNLGWHNCDLYVNDSSAQPAIIKVQVPNADQYDELLVGILFNQLNANIQLVDYGNGQFETNRDWAIRLPQVPARIVVIGIRGKRWFKYEQLFTVGTGNEFIATMQAVSSRQMNEFIGTNAFKQPETDVAKQSCFEG